MSLSAHFNKSEKRQKKALYRQLAKAIKAEDLDGVRAALKAGADVEHKPGYERKKQPLALALVTGNEAVFSAVMEAIPRPAPGSRSIFSDYLGEFDFRFHEEDMNKTPSVRNYFMPGYLYAAIEYGKKEIALALVNNPDINVEYAGSFYPSFTPRNPPATPLELARSKGYTDVAAAIESRLAPLKPACLEKEAAMKITEARKMLAEARALNKEAAALRETAAQIKPSVPGSNPKLRLLK